MRVDSIESAEDRRKRLHRERIARYRATEKGQAVDKAVKAKYNAALRAEVFAAMGNACSCCGEHRSIFLTIDHINNDGGGRTRKFTGPGLWLQVRKSGYDRTQYRVQCFNCNTGRHINGGVCPHEEERR